jgi:hypothetical protein
MALIRPGSLNITLLEGGLPSRLCFSRVSRRALRSTSWEPFLVRPIHILGRQPMWRSETETPGYALDTICDYVPILIPIDQLETSCHTSLCGPIGLR